MAVAARIRTSRFVSPSKDSLANPFVHIELNTDDLRKSKKFYQGLFDWKLGDMKMGPGMTYTMIDAGKGKTGGGMQKKPMPDVPTNWLAYVEVDDVKKTIAKARKLGANIVLDFQEIPGMGAMGIFVDPMGAALGVWEPQRAAVKKVAKKKAPKKAAKKSARR